jgi:hypothetical protein
VADKLISPDDAVAPGRGFQSIPPASTVMPVTVVAVEGGMVPVVLGRRHLAD